MLFINFGQQFLCALGVELWLKFDLNLKILTKFLGVSLALQDIFD